MLMVQLKESKEENRLLLNKILNEGKEETVRYHSDETETKARANSIPWPVKRQMLETEAREKARALREAPRPLSSIQTEKLEKEVLQESTN
jgi:hypothetical protein